VRRFALAGGLAAGAVLFGAVATATDTDAFEPPEDVAFEPAPIPTTTTSSTVTTTTTAPVVPGSSTTVPPPTTTTTAPPPPPGPIVVSDPVTFIGDSVMLGSQNGLRQRFTALQLNAVVARQARDVVQVVSLAAAAGTLSPTVVVQMGNNGPIPDGVLDDLLAAAGDRRLVLVTVSVPRRWESQVNDSVRQFVAAHPEVKLVDWKDATSREGGLTVSDGVHLTSAGISRFSDLIAYAITH
jgi:hypothetical protein